MILTEAAQFQELERRLDAALQARTFRELHTIMGEYLNINIPELPQPLRDKFDRMIHSLSQKACCGPYDDDDNNVIPIQPHAFN